MKWRRKVLRVFGVVSKVRESAENSSVEMGEEREIRKCEIPFDLDLSVEVWFGYRKGHDLSVAVLQGGVDDLVTRHFTWDELYDAIDYEDSVESLREQVELENLNYKKAILKRMKSFVREKGFQMARDFEGVEGRITDRTQPRHVMRIINGALKSCIDAHGPITHDTRSSAAKRIAKQFAALVKEAEIQESEAA